MSWNSGRVTQLLTLWALTALHLFGQGQKQTTDDTLRFEVAVVRASRQPAPVAGGGSGAMIQGGPGTDDPTRWTCTNLNMRTLLRLAYPLKTYQVTYPDWTMSTEFDIAAKVPEGATKEQLPLMIRNLLVDRFKLAAHLEKKEMQIYEMTVAPGGPKFQRWTLPPLPPDAPLPSLDAKAADFIAPLHRARDGLHHRRAKESMEGLAAYLSTALERPVISATGLTADDYDTAMDFVLLPRNGGRGKLREDAPLLAPGQTLMKAVETQLGLKLEAKKGTIEVFIIDHLEKSPTVN